MTNKYHAGLLAWYGAVLVAAFGWKGFSAGWPLLPCKSCPMPSLYCHSTAHKKPRTHFLNVSATARQQGLCGLRTWEQVELRRPHFEWDDKANPAVSPT